MSRNLRWIFDEVWTLGSLYFHAKSVKLKFNLRNKLFKINNGKQNNDEIVEGSKSDGNMARRAQADNPLNFGSFLTFHTYTCTNL